ncbi:Cyclic GMP-AMP synthase [Collichthys lucidus]|uniref:Cyclic GMP-AMP synthase n=1 Tax=Collichthys lucidus TaxID=240159 RepID=A0A4U5VKD8_COLLU|nr:Cyclic GMP-AMP synthase [Collichthys lucidus]
MLLKSLIEGLKQRYPKELHDLCSYHGKTVFLHTLSIRFSDSMWNRQKLPACFMHLLGALENHACQGDLPHFFVPNCNLFSPAAFPRKALDFLVKALEEQRMEGLPLLKPATPVPPLRLINTPSGDASTEMSTYNPSTGAVYSVAFMKKFAVVFAIASALVIFVCK